MRADHHRHVEVAEEEREVGLGWFWAMEQTNEMYGQKSYSIKS